VADLRGLFSDLVRLEIELWEAVDRRLRGEFGISMGSFDVMQAIARTPACRVFDIARQLSITVGGTSKAVDRIEASGYLVRRSNPDDRRSSIIALTPAGTDLFGKASAAVDAELEIRLGSALSPRALQQLSATIAKLRSACARADAND
jgi:MarR family transcriptional regulator, organic hydroperoxide resistance regulator